MITLEQKRKRQAEYQAKWYAKNREQHIRAVKKWKLAVKDEFREYKRTLFCVKCGYNRCPEVLHFHHRDPDTKDFEVGKAWAMGKSMAMIMEEIEKCDVLCANCHGEVHYT